VSYRPTWCRPAGKSVIRPPLFGTCTARVAAPSSAGMGKARQPDERHKRVTRPRVSRPAVTMGWAVCMTLEQRRPRKPRRSNTFMRQSDALSVNMTPMPWRCPGARQGRHHRRPVRARRRALPDTRVGRGGGLRCDGHRPSPHNSERGMPPRTGRLHIGITVENSEAMMRETAGWRGTGRFGERLQEQPGRTGIRQTHRCGPDVPLRKRR
jgi:hypothetical protein